MIFYLYPLKERKRQMHRGRKIRVLMDEGVNVRYLYQGFSWLFLGWKVGLCVFYSKNFMVNLIVVLFFKDNLIILVDVNIIIYLY